MNQIDFLKLVNEIRNNCGLECFGPTYYIFIYKDLRRATVNKTGYVNMNDVEYVIAVCAYRWENLGYHNSSLTQLVMVDHDFNPVDSITFGNWALRELGFTNRINDWYNKYKPYPHLELISDPSINNYKPMEPAEIERFPQWDWKCQRIEDFNTFLTDVHEFAAKYPL
ncbi:MAG: hypothetical protein HDS41_05890 [Bacteroides sp.]|nr:hypothetical protein [Bacteroides sp.]